MSGIPFNGPDVPGFGGHADKDLAIAWYKAGCLFPFLRNHACAGTADQEPWAFGPEALEIIRNHVRLRYKLLPYLYQLWNDQEVHGAAVMRPLFYDFPNADGMELDRIDDQFLIGPAILQAPVVQQGQQQRMVTLPGAGRWMDANTGQFIRAGRSIHVSSNAESTPIYLREGSLVPMQEGVRTSAASDLSEIELHVVLGQGSGDVAMLDYVADDGLSYGYQRGERSHYRFEVRRTGDALSVEVNVLHNGWKPLRLRIVGYDGVTAMSLSRDGASAPLVLQPHPWKLSGGSLQAVMSAAVEI